MSKTCPFRTEIVKESYPHPSGNGGMVESTHQEFCSCYESDCPYYDWLEDEYCKRLKGGAQS